MDLRQLEMLTALARTGSVTAAAASLSFTASAGSQQLARLEKEAGFAVIEPEGRGVRLTPAGELLAKHAERIIGQWDRAIAEGTASSGGIFGTVKVAAFQSACVTVLPWLVERAAVMYENVSVEVIHAEFDGAVAALEARDCDVALVESFSNATFSGSMLKTASAHFTDPMWAVAPAGLTSAHDLSDLADAAWIAEPAGSPARRWSEEACRLAGFAPRVVYESDSLFAHLAYARRGLAAAFLPGLMWEAAERPDESFVVVESGERTVSSLVRAAESQRPAVQAVRSLFDLWNAEVLGAQR